MKHPWGAHLLQIDSSLVSLVFLSSLLTPSSAFPMAELLLPVGTILMVYSEELIHARQHWPHYARFPQRLFLGKNSMG